MRKNKYYAKLSADLKLHQTISVDSVKTELR